jgi:phosphodiesterase/alkaline phosphatase D-like protein
MIGPLCRLARSFLWLCLASVLVTGARAEIHGSFAHGVASGDPTSDAIIIWTRVTPIGRDQPNNQDPTYDVEFDVTWTVATKAPYRVPKEGAEAYLRVNDDVNDDVNDGPSELPIRGGSYPSVGLDAYEYGWGEGSVEKTGVFKATSSKDWTVKIDVRGLASNVRYYYAFEVGSSIDNPAGTTRKAWSPTGTFRLPPPPGMKYPAGMPSSLKFAVFSCANWAFGYFHAYDAAAKGFGDELTAWIHLGDYYYEYGEDNYPNSEEAVAERWASLNPRNETWTLEDYRRRHASARGDRALRDLHASAPVIAMWDDHEIANNPWTGGGENHQSGWEGDYETRERNAIRAYHEWLPTREPPSEDWTDLVNGPKAYNRTLHFGDVVSFIVMETRVLARTNPNANPAGNVFQNLTRTVQRAEEADRFSAAPARWPGSGLERTFLNLRRVLDQYRNRDDARLLGRAQLDWIQAETRNSRAAGVQWQVFAQASPVMNGVAPDLEKAASRLDAEGKQPPGKHASWREALEAWTDYDGRRGDDGDTRPSRGVGGRAVSTASARALLALGKYKINWDFDDWRGYVAERKRFLETVTSSANRALILGGDSHDAWAGVLGTDRNSWGLEVPNEDSVTRISKKTTFDEAAVAEFDVPGVTPPGAFEQAFPWIPSALIDAGHSIANERSMRYARTENRGFLLFEVRAHSARGEFIFTPSVRERTYVPECDAAFEVTAAEGNAKISPPSPETASSFKGTSILSMRETSCHSIPESMYAGSDVSGYSGAVKSRAAAAAAAPAAAGSAFGAVLATAVSCAFAGGLVGYCLPKRNAGKPAAWRYESVDEFIRGEDDASRRGDLTPRSRGKRSSGESTSPGPLERARGGERARSRGSREHSGSELEMVV